MREIIKVPNIGDFKSVEIIEVLVKNGEEIKKGDPLITLESDKSSVEVPSPLSGKILNINVKIGDKVSEGDTVLEIDSLNNKIEAESETSNEKIKNQEPTIKIAQVVKDAEIKLSDSTGASPNTLKFARELGININELQGSGRGGRVKKEDIKNYIKNSNVSEKTNITTNQDKLDLPYEHSEFGDVDIQKIPRIKRLSGPHLVKAWNSIPHVTQHDEIDVTEMEDFRNTSNTTSIYYESTC